MAERWFRFDAKSRVNVTKLVQDIVNCVDYDIAKDLETPEGPLCQSLKDVVDVAVASLRENLVEG